MCVKRYLNLYAKNEDVLTERIISRTYGQGAFDRKAHICARTGCRICKPKTKQAKRHPNLNKLKNAWKRDAICSEMKV